jgi:hypothetical protein
MIPSPSATPDRTGAIPLREAAAGGGAKDDQAHDGSIAGRRAPAGRQRSAGKYALISQPQAISTILGVCHFISGSSACW